MPSACSLARMIEELVRTIPTSVMQQSGQVLYAGRSAFSQTGPLYILGANPGGDAIDHSQLTVERHTRLVLEERAYRWSAYQEESWRGLPAEKSRLRRGILHLLAKLDVDPKDIPSSNVCFVRSRRLGDVDFKSWAEDCWAFHEAVINLIGPRLIVCLGRTAGKFVRGKVGASDEIDRFVESYDDRSWKSIVCRSREGIEVAQLTHPARADWRNPAADPSEMVKRALSRSRRTQKRD